MERRVRYLIFFAPFALTACGLVQSAPEVAFTETKGTVVTVKDQCELTFPDGKGGSVGPCNEILPRSRAQENRAATVYRRLELTYAYTSPADGQIYQSKNDVQQPLSMRVPRPGDSVGVEAHPEHATVSRLR